MPPSDHPVWPQEIVFIGAGMDEAAIVALLDAALLNDYEMVSDGTNAAERLKSSASIPPDPPANPNDSLQQCHAGLRVVCCHAGVLRRLCRPQEAYRRKHWPSPETQ